MRRGLIEKDISKKKKTERNDICFKVNVHLTCDIVKMNPKSTFVFFSTL